MNKLIIFFLVSFSLLFGKATYGTKNLVKHYDRVLIKEYLKELDNLTPNQKYYLEYVYRTCMSYGLGNTCVAIAWEESGFNKWGLNGSGDYGLMGINLYWYCIDNNINFKNKYKRLEIATKLIRDDRFNLSVAINKLLKLKEEETIDGRVRWKRIWGRYNGGTYPNWYYSKRILNKIKAFRIWLQRGN